MLKSGSTLLCLAIAACSTGEFVSPGPPTMSLVPLSQDYGTVVDGESSAPVLYTLQNTGTARTGTLIMGFTGHSAGDFTMSANGCAAAGALDPGASCTFMVALTPNEGGFIAARVAVRADPGGQVEVPVTGIANTPAALAIAPASYTFPTIGLGYTNSFAFTLSNNGDQISGPPSASLTGSGASQFTVDTGFCTMVIRYLDCGINVTFAPTAAGTYTATVHVAATPGGTLTATVHGTGL